MAGWKTAFNKYSSFVEEHFDDLVFSMRRKLKLNDPVQIVTYRSYGTANRLYIKGRVLENRGIKNLQTRIPYSTI